MRKSWISVAAVTTVLAASLATVSAASATSNNKSLSPSAMAALKAQETNDSGDLIGQGTFRLSGDDRYSTAVEVSQRVWSEDNTGAVFLATGLNFPDALAESASTSQLGPLLLTKPNVLPEATRAELARLRPCLVYIAGGDDVVSQAVALEADKYTNPDRCFG